MKYYKYLLTLPLFCSLTLVQAETLHIAAASNLRFVLPELIEVFEQQTEHDISVSYAASGTLTTQIQHGAPFKLFLSAHSTYIQRLIDAELTQGQAVNYAQAQLAFFASNDSKIRVDKALNGLKSAIEQEVLNKVAIANPRHAPYGQAAKLALEKAGLWQQVQPYLLRAENASQVVQFSLTPSVEAAFVPYAHIIQPQLASQGRFVKLDVTLQQQAILLKNATETSKQFLSFIQTETAQTLFIKHGFLVMEKS
ncbi:MAG: molybdate ABC transporter substrate-binding protein [Methylophaga sp.]|nr:molybdate ABC transporter substrate-binding protein [Methylophaga sp.]